ncbi:hypothetical protein D3C79_679830 [compost metagenome]
MAVIDLDLADNHLGLRLDFQRFVLVQFERITGFQRRGDAFALGFEARQVLRVGLDIEVVELQHTVQVPACRAKVRPVATQANGAHLGIASGTAIGVVDVTGDLAGGQRDPGLIGTAIGVFTVVQVDTDLERLLAVVITAAVVQVLIALAIDQAAPAQRWAIVALRFGRERVDRITDFFAHAFVQGVDQHAAVAQGHAGDGAVQRGFRAVVGHLR